MRHGLEGIAGQIPYHLFDLVAVGHDGRQVGWGLERKGVFGPGLRAVFQQGKCIADEPVELEAGQLQRPWAGIPEKVFDGAVEAVGFAQHNAHELVLFVVEPEFRLKHLNRAAHGGQRVANLVGNPGRHLAERRQPVLAADFFFELEDFRQVLEGKT